MGAPLFERNVHGLKLTEIGEEFYRTVTKFLEDCDSLKEKIAFKIQNETIMNQLSLLTNSGFGCFAFPYMLRELRHKFPDIRVYKLLSYLHKNVHSEFPYLPPHRTISQKHCPKHRHFSTTILLFW